MRLKVSEMADCRLQILTNFIFRLPTYLLSTLSSKRHVYDYL